MPMNIPQPHRIEPDLYLLLNVQRNATAAQLRSAYRKLSQIYHPDKHPEPSAKLAAEARFTAIKEAYEILIDEKLRPIYDEFGLHNAREAAAPAHELTPYVDLVARFRLEAEAQEAGAAGGGAGGGNHGARDAYFTIFNDIEARVDGTGLTVALEDGFTATDAPLAVVSSVMLTSRATAYVAQSTTLTASYQTYAKPSSARASGGVGELALGARYQLSHHVNAEASAHFPVDDPAKRVYIGQITRTLDKYSSMTIKTVVDPSNAEATTTLGFGRAMDERRNASLWWSTGAAPGVTFQWRREAYDEFIPESHRADSDDEDSDDEESEATSRRGRLRALQSALTHCVEPCGIRYFVSFGAMPVASVALRRPIGASFPLFERCEPTGTGGGPNFKAKLSLSASRGWEVEVGGGDRYVMTDTAWNTSVACGSKGVVWKLKVYRGGHQFVLPVVLVSSASDAKAATMAAIATSILVTAVHSLIVRPLARLREAEEKAEARQMRMESLERWKEEAEAALKLLERQLETIRDNERAVVIDGITEAGLLVERAVYGLKKVVTPMKLRSESLVGRELEMEAIEVGDALQALVECSSVQVVSSTKSTLAGFWDASAFGEKEELALKVWYRFKGALHECVVDDMDPLELPLSNHRVSSWT